MFQNSRQMAVDQEPTKRIPKWCFPYFLLLVESFQQQCAPSGKKKTFIQAGSETPSTDSGTTATHGRVTRSPVGKPLRPHGSFGNLALLDGLWENMDVPRLQAMAPQIC